MKITKITTGILAIVFLSMSSISAFAQAATGNNYRAEKRDAKRAEILQNKINFINDKVNLNETEAEAYWSLFKEYEAEKNIITDAYKESLKPYRQMKPEDLTDEQANEIINAYNTKQTKIYELNNKYQNKYLSVVSPQQLIAIQYAEREFKKVLVNEVSNKRPNNSNRNHQGPPPNENGNHQGPPPGQE